MGIYFDEKNLLAAVCGSGNGVTGPEVERAKPRALEALQSFQRLVEQNRYGFPHLPFQAKAIRAIEEYAAGFRGTYDTVCVVGIGGSALGAWALDCAIRGPHPVQGAYTPEHPRLVILDNVDPVFVHLALASMDPQRTMVAVIAKSGGTAETVSTFLIVREWLNEALGAGAPARIAAVTTEGRGDLFALAKMEGYAVFGIPENVGGRFSVLSAVGLLPAALIRVNIAQLAHGAAKMTHECWQPDLQRNIALQSALYHWLILTCRGKTIQVAFPYSNQLWGTAFWFRQLWAESLGKAKDRKGKEVHAGQTPVAALGATDQHSQVQLYIEGPNDKVFSFWTVKEFADLGQIPETRFGLAAFDLLAGHTLAELIDAEQRATAASLVANGRPNCTFTLDRVDEEHIGAFLQMLEFQTAFMGEFLDIDAFNQEGVELGKKFTYGLMGREGYEEYRQAFAEYEKKRSGAGR